MSTLQNHGHTCERKPLGRTSHGLVWCTMITDLLKNFGKKHSFQWKISLDWWWGLLSQFLSLENGEIITPPLFIYIYSEILYIIHMELILVHR